MYIYYIHIIKKNRILNTHVLIHIHRVIIAARDLVCSFLGTRNNCEFEFLINFIRDALSISKLHLTSKKSKEVVIIGDRN